MTFLFLRGKWNSIGNSRNIASFDREASTVKARIVVVELCSTFEAGQNKSTHAEVRNGATVVGTMIGTATTAAA